MDFGMKRLGAHRIEVAQTLEYSFRHGPNQNIQTRGVGERPEIPISGKERNSVIDAALGDQGITEPRFAALCQHLCA
jgi:hypothetical protein